MVHTRFALAGGTTDSNALALFAIENPIQTAVAGQQNLVRVAIENNGFKDLISCTINWSVNGVLQTPYNWTGMLPDGWRDTGIVIGSFIPRSQLYDTVIVWVGMPNGVADTVNVHDDTLQTIVYGCRYRFNGDYVIGNQTGADYATIEDFFNTLAICGASGDVVLKLQTGVYQPLIIEDLSKYLGNHTLTITSLTTNADDVIFRTTGNYALQLANTKNIVLRNITIDNPIKTGTTVTYALWLVGDLSNIEVENCKILADTTVTTNYFYPIFKTSVGVLNDVRVINNEIRGGYSGLYLYGGINAATYGTNLVVDSNLIWGQYFYATYFYYADFKSVSNNTILSRTVNQNTTWYGLRFYYCNYMANANKIHQRSQSITQPYLVYTYYTSSHNTTNRSVFSNNELIGRATTTAYGIYAYYSNLDIYNNSILLQGSGGSRGIQIGGNITYVVDCKNNNFANYSATGYPIYVATAGTYRGDYNNLYSASTYVGYYGGNRTSLTAWITASSQDQNSVRIQPVFAGDSTQSLKLFDYTGLTCSVLPSIMNDIEGTIRAGSTAIGAYTLYPLQLDAATVEVENISSSILIGQNYSANVVVANMGLDSIVSLTVNWSFNGVLQTAKAWTGLMRTYEKDTFLLGSIYPISGNNTFKIWVSNPNNTIDDNPYNDTIVFQFYGCDSLYNGTYTVGGVNADFTNIDDAFNHMNICGLGGPVKLVLASGNYAPLLLTKQVKGASNVNTVTFTSQTGNAADVRFVATSSSTIALALTNVSNYSFEKITLDATAYTNGQGVNITGACNNITIKYCNILASPTTTTTSYAVNKASGTACDNIRLIGNLISGGYYSIYFYGANTTTYNTNIYIDSNIIEKAYYGAYTFYYNDLNSFSYNRIYPREKDVSNNYYMYFYYTNHYNTVGNKWDFIATDITTLYSYFQYIHYNSYSGSGLIANNEIILSPKITSGYAMFFQYCNGLVKIYNNSILYPGKSAYGIYANCGSGTGIFEVMNNNIYCNNMPIYKTGTNVTFVSAYNNLYGTGNYVGSFNGTSCPTILAWRNVSGDASSVSVAPQYLDSTANLELIVATGLSCPQLQEVSDDIQANPRNGTTVMGCYEFMPKSYDVSPKVITSPNGTLMSSNTYPVIIDVKNYGSVTITSMDIHWSINGVAQTTYSWTGSLTTGSSAAITIGNISPISGSNNVKIWTNLPNNQLDERPYNDTIAASYTGCDSLLAGTYTFGRGGDFRDMQDFNAAIGQCGLGGPVVIEMLPDRYPEMIFTAPIFGTDSVNTITFTSYRGDINNVIIESTTGTEATIFLDGGINNVIFDKLTINGCMIPRARISAGVGLQDCDDIIIRRCKINIQIDDEQQGWEYCGIYSPSGARFGYVLIDSNDIRGAQCGVLLEADGYSGPFHFRGNMLVTRQYGFLAYGHNIPEISYNTMTFDTLSRKEQFLMFESKGRQIDSDTIWMVGNKFLFNSNSNVRSFQCNALYAGRFPAKAFIMANNEFYVPNKANIDVANFEFFYNDNMHFINNSYLSYNANSFIDIGDGGGNAIIKNNNLVNMSRGGLLSAQNLNIVESDYNNLYSTATSLSDWKNLTGKDDHSQSVLPFYINPLINSNLLDDGGLECPIDSLIFDDINHTLRDSVTSVGAYQVTAVNNNITPFTLTSPTPVSIIGATTPVTVSVLNVGLNSVTSFRVDWSVNGVAQTPYTWTGSLAPRASVNINLGSFVPIRDSNKIVAITSLPNGIPDMVPMNDTLRYYTKGCDSLLNGNYIVYSNSELNEVMDKLYHCGINAPVTIQMANGVYSPIKIDGSFLGTNNVNTVTFTSLAENPENVIVLTTVNTPALSLKDVQNVFFRNITFDASSVNEVYTVDFVGDFSNIEFYGCKILASTTTTQSTSAAVYKDGMGVANDVRFIKNTIDGGYYGIRFYAGTTTSTTTYGKDIIIDSNIVSNQYYYGIYLNNAVLKSMSYNTVLSRTANTTTRWYAIYTNVTDHTFTNANKIRQRSTAITSHYGIYLSNANNPNYSNANDTGLIMNNELVLYSTTASSAFYATNSRVRLYHNSVYNNGTGAGRGIYTSGTEPMDIRNNIFVTPSTGHPFYMGTPTQPIYADYNNYYGGGTYVGYCNGNITNLTTWRATTAQDFHSVSINPPFVKADSAYLSLTTSANMYVPIVSPATMDITGAGRYGLTAMGAYTNQPVALDAAAVDVADWTTSTAIGTTTAVKAVIMNLSTDDTLRSVTINWSVRGATQTPYNWTGLLTQYETDTINLGNFLPAAGENNVRIWTSNPNGGTDLDPANDMIQVSTYGCDSMLHGVYRIGGMGADFATIDDAVQSLLKCGVGGPTEFRIASGTYGKLSLYGPIVGVSDTNRITFTSATANASDVMIAASTSLSISSLSNLSFRYITFGNTASTIGVYMIGKCDDVEFYHCKIQVNPTASTSTYYAFYRPQGMPCDNFRFVGNTVSGGYYGFYLYGQGMRQNEYNTNVVIDSNLFTHAYYYPYYLYYNDIISFSYNTILSRPAGNANAQTYSTYTNLNRMVSNKYNMSNNQNLGSFYNYIQYSHQYNSTSEKGLVANNEFIITAINSGYGLYINSSKLDVYHNSIYSTGYSAYAMMLGQGTLNCKNNQIFAMNIPVAVNQSTNITFDHNNYYSHSGLIGLWNNTPVLTINDWISKSGDSNAVSIAPLFYDSTQSLQLVNYTGMACVRDSSVMYDIQNVSRSTLTTMGAYSLPVFEGYNLSVVEITEPFRKDIVTCYPDNSTVKAILSNSGTLPVDLSVNPATIHVKVTGAMNFQADTIISIGNLPAMFRDTITITHLMPTNATGDYHITVWVSCALDTINDDDTAYSTYFVERVILPYDVYFDSVPQEMAFQKLQGAVGFDVVGPTGAVLPPFYGSGRLAFKSSTGLGSMARAYIKQVDLQGTSKPTLNFWYQHDNQNPDKPDQMDVITSTDGGLTYQYLYTVQRYDALVNGPTWLLHQVDLTPFINQTCLLIGFEAQSYGGGDQFIDRIFIEVLQDLLPTEIRLPSELYACDLSNKSIEVVVANTTVYAVEMDRDTINLTVEITTPDSNTQVSTHRFMGKIPPMSSDTILVHTGFDFSQHGTYFIKAYIDTIKITTDVSNDTITRTITVNPDLSITYIEETGSKNVRDTVYAKVGIKNTGDLVVYEVPLRLQINNGSDIVEMLQATILPGDSVEYTFAPYIVPIVNAVQPFYQVSVTSELSCDGDASNNKKQLIIGVNIVDLILYSVINPTENECDTGFSDVYVKLELFNNGDADLTNVKVNISIDSASVNVSTISEVFASVPVGTKEYTFTTPYKVPNLDGKYKLTASIETLVGDIDLTNDTLTMEACAVKYGTNIVDLTENQYHLGQNIPNPAQNKTAISYTIPEDGTVMFKLTTINGQVIYNKSLEVLSGSHLLEIDIENLSNGIYYYSMEYQGTTITKKMNILK